MRDLFFSEQRLKFFFSLFNDIRNEKDFNSGLQAVFFLLEVN